MSEAYTYIKRRNEINKPPDFIDSQQIMQISLLPDPDGPAAQSNGEPMTHVQRNPNTREFSNFPQLTENIVNTERVSIMAKSVYHYEGGWPSDLDITDASKKQKYIKKKLEKNADNQDKFTPAVKKMLDVVGSILAKNQQINMFEEYFEDEEPEHKIEKVNIKTLKIFKKNDESGKRAVTSISWHPDGPFKLAASYSLMKFQPNNSKSNCKSYIWDINNPNVPCDTINPTSPIVKMEYNHKNVEQLGFGCYNGVIGVWDHRCDNKTASLLSEIEISHHEPVIDLKWLSSKGGNEFVSCSTDGKVIWWDIRDLSKHSDSLFISEQPPIDGRYDKIVGCTSLEYVAEYGVS